MEREAAKIDLSSVFVRQPDGNLALFSEVVDYFIFFHLNESQAITTAIKRWNISHAEASQKVLRGVNDDPIYGDEPEHPQKLRRWRFALEILYMRYGPEVYVRDLVENGFDPNARENAPDPAWVKEWADRRRKFEA